MDELNKSLEMLKETLNEEIKKVTKKNDITPVELENMTKTLCLIEKIKMIEEGEAYWDDGQSGRHYPMRSYGTMVPDPRDGWRWEDGLSGTRRSPMTGRYTSGTHMYGTPGMQAGMRSYGMPDPGYSGHSIKDRMIAKLEEMYDEAKTEHERQIVDEWISRLADNK